MKNDMDNQREVSTTKTTSLFAIAGFRNLWIGQMTSQFGDVLHTLVFLWMVLEATGDLTKWGL